MSLLERDQVPALHAIRHSVSNNMAKVLFDLPSYTSINKATRACTHAYKHYFARLVSYSNQEKHALPKRMRHCAPKCSFKPARTCSFPWTSPRTRGCTIARVFQPSHPNNIRNQKTLTCPITIRSEQVDACRYASCNFTHGPLKVQPTAESILIVHFFRGLGPNKSTSHMTLCMDYPPFFP